MKKPEKDWETGKKMERRERAHLKLGMGPPRA